VPIREIGSQFENGILEDIADFGSPQLLEKAFESFSAPELRQGATGDVYGECVAAEFANELTCGLLFRSARGP